MTTVSISQPAFLPWLGYFDRVRRSNVYIVLDHVSMGKDSFTDRNKIRTPDGWQWLKVPVTSRGDNTPICQIQIAMDGKWQRQHLKAIHQNYARAKFYEQHVAFFNELYATRYTNLYSLIQVSTNYLLRQFKIETKREISSLHWDESWLDLDKTELNLRLCQIVGATKYLAGPMSRDYLDVSRFAAAGIEVEYDDYQHPTYTQAWPGFEPYMSAIDALFNIGCLP